MNHKSVLFIGVFDTDVGPAVVNRAYAERCADWLECTAGVPKHVVARTMIMRRQSLSGILVSSTSVHHVLLLLLARLLGIRGTYLAHGVATVEMRINRERSFKHVCVEYLSLRLATQIVAVSKSLEMQLGGAFKVARHKTVTVTNGADVSVSEVGLEIRRNPKVVRIMTVGTKPLKNSETIVAATLAIADDGPIELVVVGEFLQSPKGNAGPVEVIRHSHLAQQDVLAWMRSSDIYVQVSSSESFGLAVCEAAANGCSLLVSSVVGARDALTGLDDAHVVDAPISVDSVAAKLTGLVTAARRGLGAHHSCLRTWDAAADELRNVMSSHASI